MCLTIARESERERENDGVCVHACVHVCVCNLLKSYITSHTEAHSAVGKHKTHSCYLLNPLGHIRFLTSEQSPEHGQLQQRIPQHIA